MAAQNALTPRGGAAQPKRESPDAAAAAAAGGMTPALLTSRPDLLTPFAPLTIRIEYIVENVRDAFTFVGCDVGDQRYPHAFTTHSPLPGAACCLFPTLDGIHERWTWEIEVTIPRTIGDIQGESKPWVNGSGLANGVNGIKEGHGPDSSDEDEDAHIDDDSGLDMTVVSSANFKDEVCFGP